MYNNKVQWYKIVNVDKFIAPIDEHMKSHNKEKGEVLAKSRLELKAFRYFDANPDVRKWSLEPFHIKYISPKDNKYHRYFPDNYVEFSNGAKFLVEIKSYSETIPPKKPSKITKKSEYNYRKALLTYSINQAKWESAISFCNKNDMRFIVLTEKELS